MTDHAVRMDCAPEQDGFDRRSRLFDRKRPVPGSFSFSVTMTARLKRTGEGLASDSDQSDVYVCPKKERAGMKRNPSESGTKNLADELAELRGLDPSEQRHAARRAQRRGMKIVVDESFFGEAFQRGHLDHTAERLSSAVSEVVEQDHEYIGRSIRRLDLEPRRRRGPADIELCDRWIARLGERQHHTVRRVLCAY